MGTDIYLCVERKNKDKWEFIETLDIARCYLLFGFLADVRNEDNVKPIDSPRGLPKDISKKAYNEVYDENVISYLTLKELYDADWEQVITLKGCVSVADYKKYKEFGHPDCWSKGVAGGGVEIHANQKFEMLIKLGNARPNLDYTFVKWKATIKEYCDWFLTDHIDKYKDLEPDLDNVRIVFGFD